LARRGELPRGAGYVTKFGVGHGEDGVDVRVGRGLVGGAPRFGTGDGWLMQGQRRDSPAES